jgi:hypothetical protein
MSYQLCILRTRFLLLLSVAVCLKYTTGCVTRISPSTPENIVKEERECAEHAETACGQIAFTIGLEKRTFYSNPNVEIVVVDLDTGKSRYLLAPVSELEEPRKGKRFSYQAFVYNLPVGRYELSNSRLVLPSVMKGGTEYSELIMDAGLDAKNRLPEFRVEEGKVKHLMIAEISLKEVIGAKTLFYTSTTNSFFKKPYRRVWTGFEQGLSGKEFYFYRTNKNKEGWQLLQRASRNDSDGNVDDETVDPT